MFGDLGTTMPHPNTPTLRFTPQLLHYKRRVRGQPVPILRILQTGWHVHLVRRCYRCILIRNRNPYRLQPGLLLRPRAESQNVLMSQPLANLVEK